MKEKKPQFLKMNASREENPPHREVACPDYRSCLTLAAFKNLCLDCSLCEAGPDLDSAGSAQVFKAAFSIPLTVPIATQTLSAGFALKMHALLCRHYTKGRDLWDFVWYIRRRVIPNWDLLANALDQHGPWAGSRPEVTGPWLVAALRERFAEIDWRLARQDVARFIPASGQASLASWSAEFFGQQLDRLEEYIR